MCLVCAERFARRRLLSLLPALAVATALPTAALAETALVEPKLRISTPSPGSPRVALTFDACTGQTDMRILGFLIENRIPATMFLTGRWIANNPEAVALMRANADLFEFEDHGANHVPAVIGSEKPYGITPAGTAAAVVEEVEGGAFSIRQALGVNPQFYRDATALYSRDALDLITGLGYRVGGYSLSGDWGATASAAQAKGLVAGAGDGDVILSHINQPTRDAGAGVVEGIKLLMDRGYTFVRLQDVELTSTW